MKKFIAVLLCFAAIFGFAACTKGEGEGETTEPTGRPGAWVTDAEGKVQTTRSSALVLDENDEPQVDEKGNPITTMYDTIMTYPPAEGETIPPQTNVPTVAPGNTIKNENAKWPTNAFMSKLPKAANTVARSTYQKNDHGELVTIYINDMSYADYLKYIDTCKKAGFVQKNTGTKLPEKAEAGKSYVYYSVANGLYITISFYTDEYSYRQCDVLICVSSYDQLASLGVDLG